jgi:hypothetical protein
MRIKSQRDFWAGLMFLLVGVGFAIGARTYSMGDSARPGPGYFPFGLGVLLSIMGAFILFEALTVETDDGEPVGPFAWRPLLIIIGSIIMFAVALPRLGMAISLPLLVFVSALAGDEFHWGEALVNAAILTLGSWVVFIYGLGLTIPLWPTFLAR